MRLLVLLSALAALLQGAHAAVGGVLAIDYGTEWMKASLIKAGVPFDVLLNTDSKRKIQSIVALRGEERWIGGDAANLASRFPESTFPGVKLLLGHPTSDAQVKIYESVFRNTVYTNETSKKTSYKQSASANGNQAVIHPEEYLAMQFAHVKKLAKEAAQGDSVREAVITVPVFFTQAERQAILDASAIAGFYPVTLIDDGSAVAINYAMTRSFASDAPEYHLFYDAGAGSVRATIVSFQTAEIKDNPTSKVVKNATVAEVKGLGWDKSFGGLNMDALIRDMLESQFLATSGSKLETPLRQNKRAQAKLLKEAARVKQVLSANAEAPSRVEGLAEDIDFKGLVTRDAFEAACGPYTAAFSQPILDALKSANLTMADITSVVPIGGISRVPLVRAAVRGLVGEEKIAQNLNADEAAVMGAALYGAAKSSQFRTKDIRLTGAIPYAIDVAYDAPGKKSGEVRHLTQAIFAANGKVGRTKTMTFKRFDDFSISFAYKAGDSIADVEIQGLAIARGNLTEADLQNATVKVNVEVDESNMLTVPSAQLVLPEVKEQATVAGKIKEFFSGGKEKEDNATASDNSTETASKTPKKPSGPISLKVAQTQKGATALDSQEIKDASKRLRELDQAETRKKNREEARNTLEAYIYRLRDQLEASDFVEASTEQERVALRKKLDEAGDWLWDQGETAPTKDLKQAKTELERAASGPTTRLSEAAGRGKAITEFRMGMIQAQAFLISANKQLKDDTAAGDLSKYTETELKTLESSIQANEQWLSELEKKQNSLAKHDDPALKVSELQRRTRELASQVSVLKAKRPPRRPKSKSATESAQGTSTTTAPGSEPTGSEQSTTSSAPPETTTIPARDEL